MLKLKTKDTRHKTQDSRLKTQDTRLRIFPPLPKRKTQFSPFPKGGLGGIPLVTTLCLAFLLFACGDNEEEQTLTAEENLRIGWEDYSLGNYEAAIQAFERVLAASSSPTTARVADAYNGLGWAYMSFSRDAVVNQKNMSISLSKFQEAIALDSTNADAWVGKAGLLLVRRSSLTDLRDALDAIENALQADVAYLYRHDYDSKADLYALKAQCYYYLGEMSKAGEEVERVLAIEKDNVAALAMRRLL
jgi:tetratricopeptide (TPR) repeat protein